VVRTNVEHAPLLDYA